MQFITVFLLTLFTLAAAAPLPVESPELVAKDAASYTTYGTPKGGYGTYPPPSGGYKTYPPPSGGYKTYPPPAGGYTKYKSAKE